MPAPRNLHVEETAGRAPTVVLLHHGANSLRAWDPFLPAIGGGRRVLAYDRRGFGRSPRDTAYGPRLFAEDASDLADLLRAQDAAPAHVVGHSDGGSLALLTAAGRPDLVLSVTAVAAHLRADRQTVEALRGFGPPPTWDAPLLEEYRDRHGEDWERVVEAWYQLWTSGALDGWDIEPGLGRIRCPVLVIHDRRDPLAAAEHAEGIARQVPQAVISWYDTGSHGPHRAQRVRFERELHAMWARTEEVSRSPAR